MISRGSKGKRVTQGCKAAKEPSDGLVQKGCVGQRGIEALLDCLGPEETKGHLVAEEKLDHEDSEDLKVNLGHQDCKVPREDQEQK